tara:strand:+ start:5310 stop:5528 length:219 start_codon:yes stop_codon:yes gene_type:complete
MPTKINMLFSNNSQSTQEQRQTQTQLQAQLQNHIQSQKVHNLSLGIATNRRCAGLLFQGNKHCSSCGSKSKK